MTGVYEDWVGEGHDFVVETVVEPAGEVFFGDGSRFDGEIGSSYFSEEEGVSGENSMGFVVFL